MDRIIAIVAILAAGWVQAFEAKQVFREERFTRGNVNLRPLQPIDKASWIWTDGAVFDEKKSFPVVRFRKRFASDGSPLVFDVSADPRYVLLLDGQVISRGPHKGFLEHWYYQSYEVSGLEAGEHVLEAVVFFLGEKGPLAILSSGRGGFVLKAEGLYDARLTTGKATWEVALVPCMSYGEMTDPDTMTGCENIVRGTGILDWSDLSWQPTFVVKGPVVDQEYGFHRKSWALFPTEREDEIERPCAPGSVKAAQPLFDETNVLYAAEDTVRDWTGRFQGLLAKGERVEIPARTSVRFLWDLENYYCGFPVLETSGGIGARIRWRWAEALYAPFKPTGAQGELYLHKGNRDEFLGKEVVRAMADTFLPDGRSTARFTTPWWKCGRWIEIAVRTGDRPLTLTKLGLVESRYPLAVRSSFSCDDKSVDDVVRIAVRGMESCTHEMFMDCPYFEQQMYPGDTRVEMLTLNTLSGDDRLLRFGIGIFDYSRRHNGMIRMNFPSIDGQDSTTYSLCWAMMLGDYARWHGANEFLRQRIPGLRQTLSQIDTYRNADGLLENLPGWSFEDWTEPWGWFGVAPDGRFGCSAVDNLLYVMALRQAAVAERACGDADMGDYWQKKADAVAAAIRAKFWSEERGLVADTLKKDRFSEHAQCLALLSDVCTGAEAARVFKGLVESTDLAPTTVYFSHYLFETYFKFGRADLFLKRLDLWRNFVHAGLKTPMEAPGARGRSDCHAWGAHPLYHLQTGIAGIRPAADAFGKVEVAPQPGGLRFVKASMPTPKGNVSVDLRFDDGTVKGTVTLPAGLPGTFRWKGVETPLKEGVNRLPEDAWDPFGPNWQSQWTPDLEAAIDGRIEKFRKADYVRDGFEPGEPVEVEQVSHDFVFGANMFNFDQLGSASRDAAYRAVFTNLLNGATVPFYWNGLEPEKGRPRYEPSSAADTEAFWNSFDFDNDDPYAFVEWRRPAPGPLLRFCRDHGVSVHGHAMIYHYCQPEWVFALSNDVAAVRRAYVDHVGELARQYGASVPQWDVVNESLNRASTKANPDDCGCWYDWRRKVTLPPGYTLDAFNAAAEAFPGSVRLAINDAWSVKNDAYGAFVGKLMSQGARIDVVGLQMHIFRSTHLMNVASGLPQITNGRSWRVADVIDHLQKLDAFGKPIHISEITIPSPRGLAGLSDEEADEIQSRVMTSFYRLWFSWPSVDRITYWNLVDGCGAKNERMSSGWFNRDMTPKRVARAMDGLINKTWKTRLVVKADANGRIAWRGFKGDYRVTPKK